MSGDTCDRTCASRAHAGTHANCVACATHRVPVIVILK